MIMKPWDFWEAEIPVLWPEIELTNFWSIGWHSNQLSHTSQGLSPLFLKSLGFLLAKIFLEHTQTHTYTCITIIFGKPSVCAFYFVFYNTLVFKPSTFKAFTHLRAIWRYCLFLVLLSSLYSRHVHCVIDFW